MSRSATRPSVRAVRPTRHRIPDDRRCVARKRSRARATTAAATSSTSSSASVRQSSSASPSRTIADHRRLAGPQLRGELLLDRAGEARQLGQRERAAADARDGLLDVAADELGEPSRARPHGLRRLAQHAEHGNLLGRVDRRASSVPSSAASVSLSARNARCSGWRRSFSTRSARPTTMPACGPPSSLSPEKQTRSAPAARLSARVGSSPTSTSAPEPRSSTSGSSWRRATCASLRSDGCSVKPTTRKFDWCTRRSTAVSGRSPSRSRRARAVRRADLAQPRAGSLEHVGDAEAVADLDQLAARDEHVASFGERGEREQHRGRVVVDDERRPRRRSAGRRMSATWSCREPRVAGGQVVLEVRVAARDLTDPLERRLGERRAAEVRVHDHAGRVDDAAQVWRTRSARARSRRRSARSPGSAPACDLLTRAREHACARPRRRAGRRFAAPSSSTDGRSRSCTGEGYCASALTGAAGVSVQRRS